jgi:murein tripeptide amidase MpaA
MSFCRLFSSAALASITLVATNPALGDDRDDMTRFDGQTVVRAEVDSMRELRTLLALGGDIWSESIGIGKIDVMLPTQRVRVLDGTAIEYEIVIKDVQALLDAEQVRLNANQNGIAGGGYHNEYHQQDEIFAFYDALQESRPDLVTSRVIGETIEGREIYAYTVFGGTVAEAEDAPAVYILAGAHAREWIGPATMAFVADNFVNGHGIDDRITSLVDGVVWHIVPIANPDGYQHTWDDNRLWRKTRRVNGDGTFGVDWNRNFAAGWGGPGSSGNTNSDTYRGTAPFSEPETQAIRDDVMAQSNSVAFFDVHCYSQLILWPYGYDDTEPEGTPGVVHRMIGEGIRDAIASVHGTSFAPQPAHDLYLASGTSLDWAWDDAGVYSFTYELRDTGNFGFILPPEQIIPSGEEILESFLYVGEQVLGSSAFVDFPFGFPSVAPVETETQFVVEISAAFNQLDPTTATIRTRIDDQTLMITPMSQTGENLFLATLPAAACGSMIDVAFGIDTTSGVSLVLESTGAPWTVEVIDELVLFEDDAETDQGWMLGAAGDTATTGVWVRVDPNGTAAQPEDDASDPGVNCFVTGQGSVGGSVGENDIDGGFTTLVTPLFDTSEFESMTVSFAYWYRNDAGASPGEDSMLVEFSTDIGATWSLLAEISQNATSWRTFEGQIPTNFSPSTQVRFTASDFGAGSVVEAAIDDFSLSARSCGKTTCPGDFNLDGLVDGADLGLILAAWNTNDPAYDLDGNGNVNGADLGLLLAAWGFCP